MKNILYHATTEYHYNKILNDNILFGSIQYGGNLVGERGIFVTRDFKYAGMFHGDQTKILSLDRDKLKERYKIKPVRNWEGLTELPIYITNRLGSNEFEEFIYTDMIRDLHLYLL